MMDINFTPGKLVDVSPALLPKGGWAIAMRVEGELSSTSKACLTVRLDSTELRDLIQRLIHFQQELERV